MKSKRPFGILLFSVSIVIVLVLQELALAQYGLEVQASHFDGRNGFTVTGIEYNQFGDTVANIGDVNGDGYGDIASGAFGQEYYIDCWCEETIGMVHVVFGGPDVGGAGQWSVDALDGTAGFRIPEIHMYSDFGNVTAAGDWNNDGVDDFIVSELTDYQLPGINRGICYLIYGRPSLGDGGTFDLTTLTGTNGFEIHGGFDDARIGGGNTASVKDFNADGIDDIGMCAYAADSHAGECYILFGGTDIGESGEFSLADLSPDTGIVIKGIAAGFLTGISMSFADDVNGDDFPDILIGTSKRWYVEEPGEAYVVFGGPDVGTTGLFELSSLDGTNGFVIRPAGSGQGFSGKEIAGLGDINGDGYGDVAISDWDGDESRWVDVIFGGPGVGTSGEFDATTLDGSNGFRMINGGFGLGDTIRHPFAVGDTNHDGFNEIGVRAGSYYNLWVVYGRLDVGGSGSIYIGEGADEGVFRISTSGKPQGVSRGGDINGDGIDDFICGIIYQEHIATGADYGKLDVFWGRRRGDIDRDGDVDLDDYVQWTTCMLGPGDADDLIPGCLIFDFNRDSLIDLRDFAGFQQAFLR